ncbi:hypothetical protein ACQKLM_21615 [Bacillus thuringiensis]|uniref:hypothetical protein n=1 Tax=Bacillus thuringiensis TaxID=1428 RepID=UPI003D06CCCF
MNIIIGKIFNLNEDGIEGLKITIKDLIDQLSSLSKLNLSELENVIIPENFGEALMNFQREKGLPIGYTDNEHARARAKVLNYISGSRKRCAIFIDKEIIGCLYDKDVQPLAINTIHHELCHVHDYFYKNKLFSSEDRTFNDYLLGRLYDNSWGLWSEYFALRKSASTIPLGSDLDIPFLKELVELISSEIEQHIKEYRFDADINKLFSIVDSKVSFLLTMTVTCLGRIHGLGDYDEDMLEGTAEIDFKNLFGKNEFNETWKNLWIELEGIYNKYPDWSGMEVFEGLNEIVLKTWNLFGIFPEKTKENELYIDVPF